MNLIWTIFWKKNNPQQFWKLKKKNFGKNFAQNYWHFLRPPQIYTKTGPYKNIWPHFREPQTRQKSGATQTTKSCCLWTLFEPYFGKKIIHNSFESWKKKILEKIFPKTIGIFSDHHKSIPKLAPIKTFDHTLESPRPVKNPEQLKPQNPVVYEPYLNHILEKK